MNTEQKVKQILSNQLGSDVNKLNANNNLCDDLGADSLDMVELVMTLEDEFDIHIPDDAAGQFLTVGSIIEFVEIKIN